ncbi:MAG: hypothetical protein H6961_08420 [Chromatiaceae bacterium]|nr:hypothetical protein [Chromatiaceae bacterium]MCP5421973.1 hypothetical protein [Chromatiaceae bacterium]
MGQSLGQFDTQLSVIRGVFAKLGCGWIEPYLTTEGQINRGQAGKHRGLYYIYPEKNFYFGKAESRRGAGTIYHRHLTHRPKLDVDLAALYGPPNIKVQPKWENPKGFREGVSKYLLKGSPSIPPHFERFMDENGKKKCRPANLDFKFIHKVDVEKLTVLVWDLDDFEEADIKAIESEVIERLEPYCNNETYRKRNRRKK